MVGDLAHGWWWPALARGKNVPGWLVTWLGGPVGLQHGGGAAWHGMGQCARPGPAGSGAWHWNNVPAWLTRVWRGPGWAGDDNVPAPRSWLGG